jgi:hypothetical protein
MAGVKDDSQVELMVDKLVDVTVYYEADTKVIDLAVRWVEKLAEMMAEVRG